MLGSAMRILLGLLPLVPLPALAAQVRIDPDGVPGTRILAGGGKLPDAIYQRFLELCGGPERADIVLIPTASGTADEPDAAAATAKRWQEAHPGYRFAVLHTRDRQLADSDGFVAPLRRATGVWLGGGTQKRLADAYLGTAVERELAALLARGGVVGGTSAGTAIQTRTMIQEGRDPPVLAQGFDCVPFAISDQHFLARQRLPRLVAALTAAPGHFGIGVDEGTALEVRGRTMAVLGNSKVVLVLAKTAHAVERLVELAPGDEADLVTWQRCAAERARGVDAHAKSGEPRVANGSLVLVGGGEIPPAVIQRFVDLAGGAAAKIVLVPTAMPKHERAANPFAPRLLAAGAASVVELDLPHPRDVTETALAVLRDATAVWFGGGRQWRLVDAFENTAAIAAFRSVLVRGGVIGGTSAGATILAELLVRGDPRGNAAIWCEGYDRGFGFLPGCAVDQHFVARQREGMLQALIAARPQWLGIGIDEGTAAIVRGSELSVLGASKIAIIAVRTPNAEPTVEWLTDGDRIDLAHGQRDGR
jgi:cyanophycinase